MSLEANPKSYLQ